MTSKTNWLVYTAVIIIALVVIGYFWSQNNKCRDNGSTYVRTFWGMECI